jgi:hypothetical protein
MKETTAGEHLGVQQVGKGTRLIPEGDRDGLLDHVAIT